MATWPPMWSVAAAAALSWSQTCTAVTAVSSPMSHPHGDPHALQLSPPTPPVCSTLAPASECLRPASCPPSREHRGLPSEGLCKVLCGWLPPKRGVLGFPLWGTVGSTVSLLLVESHSVVPVGREKISQTATVRPSGRTASCSRLPFVKPRLCDS